MRFSPLPLSGAYTITPEIRSDSRGAFARTFCADEFAEAGLESTFVQSNQSWNAKRGTLRGMHFQHPPFAEAKYIRCIQGAVYDVIIDIRQGSPTFLQHVGVELSEANHVGIYVPPGFAHGFITLADNSNLVYMHTAKYAPGSEGGLNWADAKLGIEWPLSPSVMSEKDVLYPFLTDAFIGVDLGISPN
jgi:dTDP-4-dehydrorhamnose 3,5-epimerase